MHVLTIEQLTTQCIITLLDHAERFIDPSSGQIVTKPLLLDQTVAMCFFEPSTRTRLSFELAAKKLGAYTLSLEVSQSSLQKGETLIDTIKTLGAMGVKAVVIRHPDADVVQYLAQNLDDNVILINAGNGSQAHPTQALQDLMVIRRHKSNFSTLKIAIVGDVLHARVARSLIAALQRVSVKELRIIAPMDWLDHSLDLPHHAMITEDMTQGLSGVDVVYVLRVQRERFKSGELIPDTEAYRERYSLTLPRLALAQPDVIVMHPGPVYPDMEMSLDVLTSDRCVVNEQVFCGVAMRMAVFQGLLLHEGGIY